MSVTDITKGCNKGNKGVLMSIRAEYYWMLEMRS